MVRKINLHLILWLLFLAGTVIGLYFQFHYHKFLNFDTLAYINIAELYAKGDLPNAINACWSPMYSWILAGCKILGVPMLNACYVINFLAAGLCFNLLIKISRRYLKNKLWYYAFCFYCLSLLLYFAMSTLTPDLLATVFSLWFIRLISREHFYYSKTQVFYCGLAAAGMYFAKSYNFVALHIFFIALIAIPYFSAKVSLKRRLKQLTKAYIIFLAFCLPWIVAISLKEDKLVFSSTGRFTHNLVSPDYKGYYPIYNKIHPPPFEDAYFIMFDPTHTLDEYNWSPFENFRNFKHQVLLVLDSIKNLYLALDKYGAKGIIIIAALIILYRNRQKHRLVLPGGLRRITAFGLLYPLFYLPIFITDRYVFICIFLFHLILFYLIQQVAELIKSKYVVPLSIALLVFSLVPFGLMLKKKLSSSSGEYSYYKTFFDQLPAFSFLDGENVAADPVSSLECVQLCYYLKCRYYATWMDKKYESLKDNQIRFYISKTTQDYSFLQLKAQIPVKGSTFYVYQVK